MKFVLLFSVLLSLTSQAFGAYEDYAEDLGDFALSTKFDRLSTDLNRVQNPQYLHGLLADVEAVRAELKAAETRKQKGFSGEVTVLEIRKDFSELGRLFLYGSVAVGGAGFHMVMDSYDGRQKTPTSTLGKNILNELNRLKELEVTITNEIASDELSASQMNRDQQRLREVRDGITNQTSALKQVLKREASSRVKWRRGKGLLAYIAAMFLTESISNRHSGRVVLSNNEKEALETFLDSVEHRIQVRLAELAAN